MFKLHKMVSVKQISYNNYLLFCTLVPDGPPVGVSLDARSPYNVFVEWSPPRVPNGIITRYTIYVGFEDGSVDVFYVNGVSTLYNITNLQPYQIIGVEISASTSIGEGPRSSIMEVQTAQAGKSVHK